MKENPTNPAPLKTEEVRRRRERVGIVIRDKMQKTVVVEVIRLSPHPLYQKTVKEKIRYKAHNEKKGVKVGDRVRIVETRPISKDKRWRVAEVLAV